MLTNVPTDLLRAFVTVVDLGSYTKAAEVLGRTQPAVSLQIRRLEEILRTRLLNTEGKQVRLTAAGVELGPYARQMLRLNDDMIAHFANETLSGWIRVGLPTDFSNTFLLKAITQFAANHPDVRLEVESMLSRDLRHALAADKLNIAIGIAPAGEDVYLVNSATIRPIWAMADGFRWEKHLPCRLSATPTLANMPKECARRCAGPSESGRPFWSQAMSRAFNRRCWRGLGSAR
jgi:DNA-binding transcriptional LysR family regulator